MWNKEWKTNRTRASEFEIPVRIAWGTLDMTIDQNKILRAWNHKRIHSMVTMGRWDRNKCSSFFFHFSSSLPACQIYANQTIWEIREEFQIQSLIRVQNCRLPFLIRQGHCQCEYWIISRMLSVVCFSYSTYVLLIDFSGFCVAHMV